MNPATKQPATQPWPAPANEPMPRDVPVVPAERRPADPRDPANDHGDDERRAARGS